MKLWIVNSLDERYGSTYRIRAFAAELTRLSYTVNYYEKRKSFLFKALEVMWDSIFGKFDVLIIQKFNPITFAPILISNLRGKYVVVDWDDWDTGLQNNILLKLATWICEKTLPYLPNLITSHNTNLLKLVPKNKPILILEQGFDGELFKPGLTSLKNSSTITVGYMCTFTRGGTLDLADILKTISNVTHPTLRFLMIGGGSLLNHYKKMVVELDIKNIEFTDHVSHDQIPKTLQSLDIGLVYMEKTKANLHRSSFKVLEYMASGVMVVGQTVGETDRLFGKWIENCSLKDLPEFLNRLQLGHLPEKKVNNELLKDLLWSKILAKLDLHLQTTKRNKNKCN